MPDASPSVLPITAGNLTSANFQQPIQSAEGPWAHDYSTVYGKARRAAEAEGNQELEKLYEALRILCSFMPNFSSRTEPFQPEFRDGQKRSLFPTDLTDGDMAVVDALLERATDIGLRAHLADIIWIRRKGSKSVAAANIAVDNYIASAKRLLSSSWWRAEQAITRALRIGSDLGRGNQAFKKAHAAFTECLGSPLADSAPWFVQHFLAIAMMLGLEDYAQFVPLAQKHSDLADAADDFERSRAYRTLQADFLQREKKTSEMQAARKLVAESFIREAELWASKSPPSFIGASEALAQGIELLRRITGHDDRIAKLKALLAEYQRKSTGEMQSIPFTLDLSASVERAREHVKHDDLKEAIKRLAWAIDTIDPTKLRADVLRVANEAPLTFFSSTTLIDDAGRPQAESRNLLSLPPEEQEKELELRMFRHATQVDWPGRVDGFIQPARYQIWLDHHPAPSDLDFLVANNPFVPPGHEGILLRGLQAGFCGDMLVAAHLLTPQLENSVRYVLESNGADISNLDSNLTQPVKIWGGLLSLPEIKNAFGDSLIFEFRGLMLEKLGYNFRNALSHGMTDDSDCYSSAAVNVWWLTLRLCSYKVFMQPPPASE